MEEAVDALIDLMKEDGVWVEAQELDAVYQSNFFPLETF